MFLSDQETEVDILYYEAIAYTVVKLIGETQTSAVPRHAFAFAALTNFTRSSLHG
jgi:hypothetical protein